LFQVTAAAAATGFDFGGSIGAKRDPEAAAEEEEVLTGIWFSVMP
jgi:hypothetical protein